MRVAVIEHEKEVGWMRRAGPNETWIYHYMYVE